MRPNNNQRGRQRGRNGGGKPNKPQRNQTFDSSGPEVRVRGNAHQIFEKYQVLAREASAAGDRIAAESYYQHAEHYLRLINAMGGFNRPQDQWREGDAMDEGGDRPEGRGEGRAPGTNGYHGQGQGGEGGYRPEHDRRDQPHQNHERAPRDLAEADQPDAGFSGAGDRDGSREPS
jgi:hypothetical protein